MFRVKSLKYLSLFIALVFVLSLLVQLAAPLNFIWADEQTIVAADIVKKTVEFIKEKFDEGEKLDAYAAYVLTLAQEDLGTWSRSSSLKADIQNLKEEINALADLLGNGVTMVDYLVATQNADGSFGPYATLGGTAEGLFALAMIKNDLTIEESVYEKVYTAINKAIISIKDKYQRGQLAYIADQYELNYRAIEALCASGENLSVSDWVYQGKSLRDCVVEAAIAAAESSSVIDAVCLAKHLIALHAVDPGNPALDTLAQRIAALQYEDGAFKTVNSSGEQVKTSIYGEVLVLYALGKTGNIQNLAIDQVAVLDYINQYCFEQKDVFGNFVGYGWGGFGSAETDTTAQVIAALHYLDNGVGAADYINGGFSYLQSVQDPDTAAIPHLWDSSYATADTLIALKTIGMPWDSGNWVKNSRTKTIAQCLLAVNEWGDTERVEKLVGLLIGRQKTESPGAGSFDNSVYTDMLAFISLGEAGKLSGLPSADGAKNYILSKQNISVAEESYGAWGESFGGVFYPDFLSTCQAIRALSYFGQDEEVKNAIERGISYLKTLQKEDGGVYYKTEYWSDDPVVDNAELIITLYAIGEDPLSESWTIVGNRELNPATYLLEKTFNPDGSLAGVGNIFTATQALYAALLLPGTVTGKIGENGNTGTEWPDQTTVGVAVVGKDDEILYGPGYVTLSDESQWGTTVLGALHATGLPYTFKQYSFGVLVTSIAGQANEGMQGWMYKINTRSGGAADREEVKDGDKVIWWYSKDINSPGPSWEELVQLAASGSMKTEQKALEVPERFKPSPEAEQALSKLAELLGLKQDTVELSALEKAPKATVVVGNEKMPSWQQRIARKKEFLGSLVALKQKVLAKEGAVMSDPQGRLVLIIPPGALNQDADITAEELAFAEGGARAGKGGSEKEATSGSAESSELWAGAPEGFRRITPVYRFGPEGTSFAEPVTVYLRVDIPFVVRPENLYLAGYNKAEKKWLAVPAVVDAGAGQVLARLSHFSEYAVFARVPKKSFADLSSAAYDWAREAVETLAGAGIVGGVDEKRFEPERPITRAELVSLLARALSLPAADAPASFRDVREGDWYAGCVASAAAAGLVKGYEDGTFRPGAPISREELIAILVRVLGLPAGASEKINFVDAGEVSSWAQGSMAAAVAEGLVAGYPDQTIRPRALTSRVQGAVFLARLLEK